ncbi:MAG: NusG domain II-containing protein [Candidatus Limiplasma sp.]|nr:NusG domain II-containing protein [Candidatus Limiplasma sp.]
MFRKKDILLIFLLVVLAGGLLLALPLLHQSPPGPSAGEAALYLRYSIGGKEVATVPLTKEEELTIDQGNGMVNVLHLSPSGFFMESSTCHNQLCVFQGEVTQENRDARPLMNMVVCAPHRVVAELLEASEAGGKTP